MRVKAFFESLTIIEAGVLSGKQYITPGGAIKCTKVEETDSSYRCYFLSEQDGEKTDCKIIAGDQAIAEFFNAKTGTTNKVSNHRFWRLVTAVNNDAYTDDNGNHYGYIELSKTDCEGGSSAPVAGDEICQFGNRLDPTRQSAMVFSTVDADAPSVKLFSGINSFSLEGKAVIAFGCDPASGRVFFRLGASGAAHYLEYIQGKGLVVAGKISVKSTFTNNNGEDQSLGDLITGNDVLYISHTSRTSAPALPTVNASGVITSLNGWSTQSPEWQADKYIWQTTYVRKCDGTASFSTPTCMQGADGEDSLTVEITTDLGNVILNGEGQRMLTATVFSGGQDITADIPSGHFSWERTSADPADDKVWNRLHEGIGNMCMVTQDDIDRNAMFKCLVVVDD